MSVMSIYACVMPARCHSLITQLHYFKNIL